MDAGLKINYALKGIIIYGKVTALQYGSCAIAHYFTKTTKLHDFKAIM